MTTKRTAEGAYAAVEEELKALSLWLYENPETAYQEFESSRRISDFLGDNGFEVTYPAYGLETAFEANAGASGPRVVICCEYDALPEVGQACGHNIIATAAAGAGVALAAIADDLGIRVTVLGTPAEEGGGGKVDLINAGAFEDAAASMMIHPGTEPNLLDDSFQANYSFDVEYFGMESHAASTPQLGINALDAFVQAYVNVGLLRQALYPGDTVHAIVVHGGDASNIIPAYTSSRWGVRAETGERLQELIPKVEACLEAAATATGCRLEMTSVAHPYLNMVTNPIMADLYATNSAALGRPMLTEEQAGSGGGSTDMGNVSQVVPSIHPMLSIDAGGAVNHQKAFAAATITPTGELAIRDGALGMAFTVVDMAEQDVWDRLR